MFAIAALLSAYALVTSAQSCSSTDCSCSSNYVCCFRVDEGAAGVVVGNVGDYSEYANLISDLEPDEYSFTFEDGASSSMGLDISAEGVIRTGVALDREASDENCLSVVVQLFISPTFRIFTFAVEIEDVNDVSPSFSMSTAFFSLPEANADVRDFICDNALRASDGDEQAPNNVISYQIMDGGDAEYFSVSDPASTGEPPCIGTLLDLDFEGDKTSFNFVLQATDRGSSPLSGSITVTVEITDANDNEPTFTDASLSLSVPENKGVGEVIRTVMAEDVDSGTNREISYSMTSNSPVPFDIDPMTGVLNLTDTLDRESDDGRNGYQFLIWATDKGEPPRSGSVSVTVSVEDVNEEVTVMDIGAISAEVEEGSGYSDLFRFSLNDEDDTVANRNNTLRFVTGGEYFNSQFFTISLISPGLNREEFEEFNLRIEFIQGGNPEFRGIFFDKTIIITDINDNAPNLSPDAPAFSFLEETSSARITVVRDHVVDPDVGDNSVVGSFQLISAVTDPAGMDVTSEFVAANNGQKQLSPDGSLFAPNLDREEHGSYVNIIIQLTDSGSPRLSRNVTLSVEILDQNDNPPTFTSEIYELSVCEHSGIGHSVGSVQAHDPDVGENAEIEYYLMEDSEDFAVNLTSGTIVTKRDFDREQFSTSAVLQILVMARDRGSEPMMSVNTAQVIVTIDDVNDNRPEFVDVAKELVVSASAGTGSVVGHVQATDDDQGVNKEVHYRIEPQTLFAIDDLTGEVTVKQPLSDHKDERRNITIIAFNLNESGEETLSSNMTVSILISPPASLVLVVVVPSVAGVIVLCMASATLLAICCFCCNKKHHCELEYDDTEPAQPVEEHPPPSYQQVIEMDQLQTQRAVSQYDLTPD